MKRESMMTAINNEILTRRQLLKGSGAMVFTFSLSAAYARQGALAQEATPTAEPGAAPSPESQTQEDVGTRNVAEDQVDSYLAIGDDSRVTVYCGKVELGTGIKTALSQIVAEQLGVAFEQIDMIMGDTALTPDQGTTAGSKSIQVAGPVLEYAAAEARAVLLDRASDQLGVPVEELNVEGGVVTATSDPDATITYGELLAEGFERALDLEGNPFSGEVTGNESVVEPPEYTIIGQSIARVDIPPKLTGQEIYVQDLRVEGMLHGRVVRPWLRTPEGVGATVEAVDESSVSGIPGLVQVVREGNFVGVVAEQEFQAIQAAEQLAVTWAEGDALPPQVDLYEYLRSLPVAEDEEIALTGDVDGAFPGAARTFEATYQFPFQAHASMGPSCAVADVRDGRATVYSSTQSVYGLRGALSGLLGMDEAMIRVVHMEGAGCYGHNGFDDASADAALLSRAVGQPVRVQWMRQDEFAWEPKGPAMLVDVRGGLDDQGNVVAWDYGVWSATHSTRPGGDAGNLIDGQLVDPPAATPEKRYIGGDRNAPHLYAFPNNRVMAHWLDMYLFRPSALRSLGGLTNSTAIESFMDELAAAAGVDPIEFRLRYLEDQRAIDVVNKVAEAAGWQARPAGAAAATPASGSSVASGRGVAFGQYESEFAYVAAVAEADVDQASGEVRVTRVVVAHDAGRIINPDGLTNQIEGNVIQGISRALKEEITWDERQVTSLDWASYPILTFAEIPDVEVALIDRPEQPSLGAGEPAICVMVAAVGNAIFDATGIRLRTIPFTPERVMAALG